MLSSSKVEGIGLRVQDLEGELTMIDHNSSEFNRVNLMNRSG